MPPADYHPDDDTLESYSMGQLRGTELAWLEEHLLLCEPCRERLAEIEVLARAVREASEETFEPIRYVHQTGVGPVYLQIAREGNSWHAHLWSGEAEADRSFENPREAMRYLERLFAELFPEHHCTAFCRRQP